MKPLEHQQVKNVGLEQQEVVRINDDHYNLTTICKRNT